MQKFAVLTESLNYIEAHLCESVSREQIARHFHVSLSMLEKLFRHALTISIKDYITRRRMTLAARDIAKNGASVTDAAMKYQFNSVEVFSRAFKRIWGVNPSDFAAKWTFTDLFPKINYHYGEGDDLYMARKQVDISEMYDYLKSVAGTYVLRLSKKSFVFSLIVFRLTCAAEKLLTPRRSGAKPGGIGRSSARIQGEWDSPWKACRVFRHARHLCAVL